MNLLAVTFLAENPKKLGTIMYPLLPIHFLLLIRL